MSQLSPRARFAINLASWYCKGQWNLHTEKSSENNSKGARVQHGSEVTHPKGQICYKGKTGKGEEVRMKDHNFFFGQHSSSVLSYFSFLQNSSLVSTAWPNIEVSLYLSWRAEQDDIQRGFSTQNSEWFPLSSMMISFLSFPNLALLLLSAFEEEERRTGQQKHMTSHNQQGFPEEGCSHSSEGSHNAIRALDWRVLLSQPSCHERTAALHPICSLQKDWVQLLTWASHVYEIPQIWEQNTCRSLMKASLQLLLFLCFEIRRTQAGWLFCLVQGFFCLGALIGLSSKQAQKENNPALLSFLPLMLIWLQTVNEAE